MRYTIRPGVILTNICDEYFLISGKEARDRCPYVTHLNETAGFIWKKIVSGMSEEQIVDSVLNEYEMEDINETADIINSFISQLKNAGFMTEQTEE